MSSYQLDKLDTIEMSDSTDSEPNKDLFWDIDEQRILNPARNVHYEISLDVFFNARHYVVMGGVQGPVHAHSYRVRMRCQSYGLDAQDHVVVGYAAIRDRLTMIVGAYNNQCLNDLPPFRLKRLQTTTENLAAVIFQQLERSLEDVAVLLVEVAIWESPTNSIAYSKVARYVRQD